MDWYLRLLVETNRAIHKIINIIKEMNNYFIWVISFLVPLNFLSIFSIYHDPCSLLESEATLPITPEAAKNCMYTL